MTSQSPTMEEIIRSKVSEALKPTRLEIYNDSHLHAHHKAMAGSTSKETHFRIVVTSEAFRAKRQVARHKMIYSILSDQLKQEGGIHALQLQAHVPTDEEEKRGASSAEVGTEAHS